MNLGNKFPCRCCGSLTLDEGEGNSFDICDVCGWEDDGVQNNHPDSEGGANDMSLNQAKEAYKKGLPIN